RRRHTIFSRDWSSDVCSSDLVLLFIDFIQECFMASVFTQIINGNIPGNFVWKDDKAVAILTIQPIREGHVLVIPREEIDQWSDRSEERRVGKERRCRLGATT